jgi:hypothetical protein
MRYLVWANFARDGILLGAGKANVGPAGALASMIGSATCVVGGRGSGVLFRLFVCLFVCLVCLVWFWSLFIMFLIRKLCAPTLVNMLTKK